MRAASILASSTALGAALLCVAVVACGGDDTTSGEPTSTDDAGGGGGGNEDSGSTTPANEAGIDQTPIDAGTDAGSLAEQLLAKVATCKTVLTKGKYETDQGETPTVDVCGGVNAVWWTADMDIDCDGKETAECNKTADPDFQDQTAATDSNDDPLDAANLPYVVVPQGTSARWDFADSDLHLGSVVAVIYKGQLSFGVIGDTGPTAIIGEASYAMAKSLGIDSDPSTGGTDGPVTYIAFPGASGKVKKNEDHSEAVNVGNARAQQMIAEN